MKSKTLIILASMVFIASNSAAMSFRYDIEDLVSSNKEGGTDFVLEIPLEPDSPCLVASVELGMTGSEDVEVFALAEMESGLSAVDQITVTLDGTYVFDATQAARFAQANGQDILILEISDLEASKDAARGFKVVSGTATVSYHPVERVRRSASAPDETENEYSGHMPARLGATVMAVPNPFNPSTTFKLTLNRPGNGVFNIFDVSGKRVRCLHSGPVTSGIHEYFWDGRDESGGKVSSGLYMYQYVDENQAVSGKVMLLK